MRKQFFTVALAAAAIPGLAAGGDDTTSPKTLFPSPVRASQAVAAQPPVGAEPAPRPGSVLDCPPGLNASVPCMNVDWACNPPTCFWVRGETLLWWTKESQFPALITTGVQSPLPGVLGQPGTTVLFGGPGGDNQMRVGGRFSAGLWLNDCRTTGLEASYFFLGSRSVNYDGNSALIARPFFDVIGGTPNAQLVAYPGIASGEIHLNSTSSLWGAELNVFCIPCITPRCTPSCDPCGDQNCGSGYARNCNSSFNYSVSLLGGFRYLQLDESLGIIESSRVNPALAAGPPLFGGSTITIADQFDTHNYFYGGQIGARAELCWGRLFVDVEGKVALGETHEVVDIHGATSITSPTGTTVTPAGFLASGSNSGRFSRDQFAVVPEFGINFGCQINRYLRASIGYTFLYWSAVARPGDQIDTGLSGTQIPTDSRYNPQAGPARPAVLLRNTDYWAQGLNLGLEFRY